MSAPTFDVLTSARAWIDQDPDAEARDELTALINDAESDDPATRDTAMADLASRFVGPLEFGTAGLRGAIGAGESRMNRAVVRRAAAGLVDWVQSKVGPDAQVVVGYDARRLSYEFAVDTAAIVTAAGGSALLMPRTLPTPLLAWAVRYLKADAGVMVTASHNPPQDNGYKVYLGGRTASGTGNGVQIVPPADKEIAARIQAAPPANEIPLAESGWGIVSEEIIDAYVDRAVSRTPGPMSRDLSVVLTSMHGVGAEIMERVLRETGFSDVHPVSQQRDPDPAFSTVSFPNPEEDGALDLAFTLAKEVNADIIIANDPDADRCSAAINGHQGWRQLTGDEIGSLLGEEAGRAAALVTEHGTLAASIVSSRQLARIAAAHGLNFEATLTGFKWIARVENLIFGYEEAIGYCVDPEGVRDKDGITAGLALAVLAARLKSDGLTIEDELDRLASIHGVHLTTPVTIRVEDLSIIPATMAHVRANPPQTLGGSQVVSVTDLSEGSEDVPPTDAIVMLTEAEDRVVIRPSGTEPKVKCYLEVIEPVHEGGVADARVRATQRLASFREDVAAMLVLPEA